MKCLLHTTHVSLGSTLIVFKSTPNECIDWTTDSNARFASASLRSASVNRQSYSGVRRLTNESSLHTKLGGNLLCLELNSSNSGLIVFPGVHLNMSVLPLALHQTL